MIINANSSPFNNVSPAPVHGKHGKRSASASDADQTQTSSTDDQNQLSVSQQNLISANPPLNDVETVLASLKSAQQSMLSQPSQAMLAQAGSLSPNALQLLQE